jgi:hypothetical protein
MMSEENPLLSVEDEKEEIRVSFPVTVCPR